jgi:hypothetical protein
MIEPVWADVPRTGFNTSGQQSKAARHSNITTVLQLVVLGSGILLPRAMMGYDLKSPNAANNEPKCKGGNTNAKDEHHNGGLFVDGARRACSGAATL